MKVRALFLGLFSAGWVSTAAAQTVIVGNAGNPNDSTGYGAVSYTYAIGKYEVTLNQYAAFLNAKAVSDPLTLWNSQMSSIAQTAGISRSGSSGSFTYGIVGDGNRPVTFISYYSALRYANWLNNGGGSGDTETGAYTLLGGTATPSNGTTVTRNVGATVWLPSENEWYKAAYYQPAAQGGDTDGYWLYPTKTNTAPASNTPGAGANLANFFDGDYATTQGGTFPAGNVLTAVGTYVDSGSFYGTFDQGGNVREWMDGQSGGSWVLRGGHWASAASRLAASTREVEITATGTNIIGFRIATVPEPSVALSLLAGSAWLLSRRRRKLAAL